MSLLTCGENCVSWYFAHKCLGQKIGTAFSVVCFSLCPQAFPAVGVWEKIQDFCGDFLYFSFTSGQSLHQKIRSKAKWLTSSGRSKVHHGSVPQPILSSLKLKGFYLGWAFLPSMNEFCSQEHLCEDKCASPFCFLLLTFGCHWPHHPHC